MMVDTVIYYDYLQFRKLCCALSSRRPYHFTPLHTGSPYCTAKLGFLLLAIRGAFVLPRPRAFLEGNFTIREEAKSWPLLCQVDYSTGQLKVFQRDSAV